MKKVSAPFAGPISFPLLVAEDRGIMKYYKLSNSCQDTQPGEIVLDSITNIWKNQGYTVKSGVSIRMYSIIGDKRSQKIYTVRKGTLADYNARLLALHTGKEVVNATPEEVLRMSKEGFAGVVGNEVALGEPLEEEFQRMGILVPSCFIAFKEEDENLLKIYDEGIRIMREEPDLASSVISEKSKYYEKDTMRKIISFYNHKRTENTQDLKKALEVYSKVETSVIKIRII